MIVPGRRILLSGIGLLAAAALCMSPALADEIRLKDGKKLYGVIVAYEDNMFKVKTDFGYVLVEKDKIASIIPDTPGQATTSKPEQPGKTSASNEPKPATEPDASAAKKEKAAVDP